jgi:hypothetical protein
MDAVQVASGHESARCVRGEPTEALSSTHLLPRRSTDCVEKILAASALCQAVEDLQKFQYERRDAGQMLYQEVCNWITSNDSSSPYSFLNLCGALDLAPDRLRAELLACDSSSTART